eukprot:TRINITY_DN19376_c0_g2_i1.p1 TRINITY_DN19376_c0_g2~~TRINITY_DN19376_c0_g2_i1.p1  ORF type:complete len:402 (+),score=72.38 TRINITY_DN19376_c0_g2_i1:45-1250(+)
MMTDRTVKVPQDLSSGDDMISAEGDSSSNVGDDDDLDNDVFLRTVPVAPPDSPPTTPIACNNNPVGRPFIDVANSSDDSLLRTLPDAGSPTEPLLKTLPVVTMDDFDEHDTSVDVVESPDSKYSFERLFTCVPRVVDGRSGGYNSSRRERSRRAAEVDNLDRRAVTPPSWAQEKVSLFGINCLLPDISSPNENISNETCVISPNQDRYSNQPIPSPSYRCSKPTPHYISLQPRDGSRSRTPVRTRSSHYTSTSSIPLYRRDLMRPETTRSQSRRGTTPTKGERRRSSSAKMKASPQKPAADEQAAAALKKFDAFKTEILSQYLPSAEYPPGIQRPRRVKTNNCKKGIFTRSQGIALLDALQVEVDELKLLKQRISEGEFPEVPPSPSPTPCGIQPLSLRYC